MYSLKGKNDPEQTRSAIAIVMASFLVLFLVISMLFLVKEAGHDCIGEDCPVCAEMLQCGQTIRQIGGAVLFAALILQTAEYFFEAVCLIISDIPAVTPVSRKIRLNN